MFFLNIYRFERFLVLVFNIVFQLLQQETEKMIEQRRKWCNLKILNEQMDSKSDEKSSKHNEDLIERQLIKQKYIEGMQSEQKRYCEELEKAKELQDYLIVKIKYCNRNEIFKIKKNIFSDFFISYK